jgi:hypothetical protein
VSTPFFPSGDAPSSGSRTGQGSPGPRASMFLHQYVIYTQFVEDQSRGTWDRGGITAARLWAYDGLGNGEEMVRLSASIDGYKP